MASNAEDEDDVKEDLTENSPVVTENSPVVTENHETNGSESDQEGQWIQDSSDIESENDARGNENEDDPEMKRRRIEIIRKLLEEFDLEETIDRYRCLHPRQYSFDETDFSLDSAMANSRVKRRIEHLMGTDIIRLNDKSYMETLEEKIQCEYDTVLDKMEAEREQAEKLRMHRLAMQGLGADEQNDRNKSLKRKRQKSLLFRDDDPFAGDDIRTLVREHRKPGHQGHGRYVDRRLDEIEMEDDQQAIEDRPETPKKRGDVTGQASQDDDKHDGQRKTESRESGSSEDNRTRKKKSRKPRDKHETPLVKEMRQEETVSGLYSIAQKLVY